MCVSHSNVIIVVQLGGGISWKEIKATEKMMACGQEIHGVGKVPLVSKTHIFSLNLLPLSRKVWLYGDNHSICPLSCSNYDKEYYKWRLWVPMDSSPNPEDHLYGAQDLRALPTWDKVLYTVC